MPCPSVIRPRPHDKPTPAQNGENPGGVGTLAPGEDSNAYPYVDVPQLCYSDWLKTTDGIGQYTGDDKILIIGAGVSGSSAAYELAKIGVDVTVVNADTAIGGRAASENVPCNPDSKNVIELGAMRFPASESIMDHYVQKFKILDGKSFTQENVFPDPGKVPTIFSTDGKIVSKTPYWDKHYSKGGMFPLPTKFNKVHEGWSALITQPLRRRVDGKNKEPTIFANQLEDARDVDYHLPSLKQLLQSRNVSEATAQWQIWINEFETSTFYGAMFEIFTGRNGWVIPPYKYCEQTKGGQKCYVDGPAWDVKDFDLFGQLGVGSGGFGSLYPINFPEIIRLIVNGLESTQYFFPPGIRTLPERLLNAAQGKDKANLVKKNATVHNGVLVTKVKGSKPCFKIETKQSNPVVDIEFTRVIVATTIRSMECTMNVAGAVRPEMDPDHPQKQTVGTLISADASTAVRRVHTTSSIKVAAQIKKYWKGKPAFPRCFLSDDIIKQVYTLEYEKDDDTAVCFITYSWDDDAIRQQGLGISADAPVGEGQGSQVQTYSVNKQKLYKALHQRMLKLANQNPDYPDFRTFVEGLYPYDQTISGRLPKDQDYPANAILYVEWQSLPSYNAAFKLSEPGQDSYVQEMFYDYQKAGTDDDTGVYLAGDTIGWTAGWIEGGLYTGLNAAAGIVQSIGGKVNSQQYDTPTEMKGNPMELEKKLFNYFPATRKPTSKPSPSPECTCADYKKIIVM